MIKLHLLVSLVFHLQGEEWSLPKKPGWSAKSQRKWVFFSALYSNWEKLSTCGKTSLERAGGGGKCSVWKNPSSMASHSDKAQNTSLHNFRIWNKNHKLQLWCAVRNEQEDLGACWRSEIPAAAAAQWGEIPSWGPKKRNTSSVMKNHQRAGKDTKSGEVF